MIPTEIDNKALGIDNIQHPHYRGLYKYCNHPWNAKNISHSCSLVDTKMNKLHSEPPESNTTQAIYARLMTSYSLTVFLWL